ncbi:hypothetical protein [Chryseobacterium rhizosphaerae]|uniref:hypothetical protein n=1 Tax=Chryseobacterium rhizosphaerae TaxID=395937 RepID=UPI003D0B2DB1
MMKLSNFLLLLLTISIFSCKKMDKQGSQEQTSYTKDKTEKIIEKKDDSSEINKIIKDSLLSKETIFTVNASFNNDQIKYRIEVLKNNSDKDAYDQLHFNLPIKIYKGNTLWKSNDHLVFEKRNTCISEGFSTVAVKNNYFTIEHQDCSDYNVLVSAYITFKVIGNEIYLHKYGESYFDKSNHERSIPMKVWTEKNFGKIKFEDVTAEFFQKLK